MQRRLICRDYLNQASTMSRLESCFGTPTAAKTLKIPSSIKADNSNSFLTNNIPAYPKEFTLKF
jgi:hypothetical protein